MRKYLAEITGTFILTFTVILSLAGAAPMATPVAAALAVGIGVYMFGSLSGAHFNPAITLGVLAVRKISVQDAVLYITSQLIGAGIATILARTIVQMPEFSKQFFQDPFFVLRSQLILCSNRTLCPA